MSEIHLNSEVQNPDDQNSKPVTTQPKSKSKSDSKTPKIDVPNLDWHNMIKGNWNVGMLECLKDPSICKYQ